MAPTGSGTSRGYSFAGGSMSLWASLRSLLSSFTRCDCQWTSWCLQDVWSSSICSAPCLLHVSMLPAMMVDNGTELLKCKRAPQLDVSFLRVAFLVVSQHSTTSQAMAQWSGVGKCCRDRKRPAQSELVCRSCLCEF